MPEQDDMRSSKIILLLSLQLRGQFVQLLIPAP